MVDERLPAVLRKGGIGPVVHGFSRTFRRDPKGYEVIKGHALILQGSPKTERYVSELCGSRGIRPRVLMEVTAEYEALSIERFQVKGLDDFQLAVRQGDIDGETVLHEPRSRIQR